MVKKILTDFPRIYNFKNHQSLLQTTYHQQYCSIQSYHETVKASLVRTTMMTILIGKLLDKFELKYFNSELLSKVGTIEVLWPILTSSLHVSPC